MLGLAKRLSGRKKKQDTEQDFTRDIPSPLPLYVLVVGCTTLGDTEGNLKYVNKTLRESHGDPKGESLLDAGICLFTSWRSQKDDFKDAFSIGKTDYRKRTILPFETGIVYRRHLDADRLRYFPADQFDDIMEGERHEELVDIGRHLVVHTIAIEQGGARVAERLQAASLDVSAGPVPVGDMVLGGQIASLGFHNKESESSTRNGSRDKLVFVENHMPVAEAVVDARGMVTRSATILPDGAMPSGWFFIHQTGENGGLDVCGLKDFVVTALSGDRSKKQLRIDFAEQDSASAARAFTRSLGLKLADVATGTSTTAAGIAVSRDVQTRDDIKVRYKYEITMFDTKVYDKLLTASQSRRSLISQRIRRYSGKMAALRTWNSRFMAEIRPDLRVRGLTTIPEEESEGMVSTVADMVSDTAGPNEGGSNFINIPITVYGLEGSGKTSVLATWDVAAKDSPLSFYTKSYDTYTQRVELPSMRADPMGAIVTEIAFRQTKHSETHRVPDSFHELWGKFDCARLLFNDSPPAKTALLDENGRRLPVGLQVLVMDGVKVYEVLQMDVTQEKREEIAHDKWGELFGVELEGLNHIGRYPPIAVVISRLNAISVPNGSRDDVVSEMVDLIKSTFGCKHVLAMETLPTVSAAQRDDYFSSALGSALRLKQDAMWNETAENSLETLASLMDVITSRETESIQLFLEKEEDEKAAKSAAGLSTATPRTQAWMKEAFK